MSKNLIPEVLKMLGLERGEAFKLHANDCEVCENELFAFNYNDELIKIFPNGYTEYANEKMCGILNGYYEIVKLPWEQKEKEEYFIPSVYYKSVEKRTWRGTTFGYAMKVLGMVYRTEAEAKEHFASDYEKLTGKPLSSVE